MKSKFFILLCLLNFQTAWGGGTGDISGGGHGVEINGKIFLLDFVENLTNSKPSYDEMSLSKKWQVAVEDLFNKTLSEDVRIRISVKLSEIEKFDPLLAISMYESMKLYRWTFTNIPLQILSPEDTVLKLNLLRQVAVRKGQQIYIDSSYWLKMDVDQKTGLIFHEIISSLLPQIPLSRERQWVSSFFQEKFNEKEFSNNSASLTGWLPNLESFYSEKIKKFPVVANHISPSFHVYWNFKNGEIQFLPLHQNYFQILIPQRNYFSAAQKTEVFTSGFYQPNKEIAFPFCSKAKVCKQKPLYETWSYFKLKLSFDDKIGQKSFQPKLQWNVHLEQKLKITPFETGCFSYYACRSSQSLKILQMREWLSGF